MTRVGYETASVESPGVWRADSPKSYRALPLSPNSSPPSNEFPMSSHDRRGLKADHSIHRTSSTPSTHHPNPNQKPTSILQSSPSLFSSTHSPPGTCDHILAGSVENWNDLSLYERKASLIDHELDQLGMGRYQWYIFAVRT